MKTIVSRCFVICLVCGVAVPARADEAADVKAVITKAIKAAGGEENLKKFKAAIWKGKGKVYIMGNAADFSGEWYVQPPKQLKTQYEIDINGMKFTITRALNGDKGWESTMGNVQDLEGDRLAETQEERHSGWVTTLLPLITDPAFKLSTLGESKVDSRPALGVKVTHAGHNDIDLYFDKDKGLLLKTQRKAKDMAGQEVDQETFFSDYKAIGGIQRPKKITIKRDGNDFIELEMTEFKPQDKLDEKIFDKP